MIYIDGKGIRYSYDILSVYYGVRGCDGLLKENENLRFLLMTKDTKYVNMAVRIQILKTTLPKK